MIGREFPADGVRQRAVEDDLNPVLDKNMIDRRIARRIRGLEAREGDPGAVMRVPGPVLRVREPGRFLAGESLGDYPVRLGLGGRIEITGDDHGIGSRRLIDALQEQFGAFPARDVPEMVEMRIEQI